MKSCQICQGTYPSDFTVCPKDATLLVEVGAWTEGMVVRGKYRLLCKIGQGGMGAVYKAQHVRFEELRALKVITPELASDPSFVKRFIHEAVITRKLQHPNAVRVEDVDEAEDGRPFIVMEFMEGKSLKSLMSEEGPLPAPRVCSIIKQAAAALGAAHALGMVHRDIKPDNIFLLAGPEGEQVKVLDFGIAKVKEASLDSAGALTLTKTGLIVGTPKYMSPEQAMGMRGDELDGRSDLYSLGVVMYEMLSGAPPFQADTTMKILMAHMHEPPPPLVAAPPEIHIAEGVSSVVMRLLEKKRESRPANGSALIQEIDRALQAPAPRLVTTVASMRSQMVSVNAGARPAEPRQAIQPPSVWRSAAPPITEPPQPAPQPQPVWAPPVASRPLSSNPAVQTTGRRRSRRFWLLTALALVGVSLVGLVFWYGGEDYDYKYDIEHGKADYSKGLLVGTEIFFRDAVLKKPTSFEAHYWLGKTLAAEEDWDGTIREADAALRTTPSSSTDLAEGWFLRGTGCEHKEQLPSALADYQNARASDPYNPDYRAAFERVSEKLRHQRR